MNRLQLMIGAAAAFAIGLASCSEDVYDGGNGGVVEADEVRYLKVAISDAHGGTRAGATDFDQGTAEENYVDNVSMVFYDRAGNFIYRATPSDITWNPANGQPGNDQVNVEKKGTATVTVNLKKDQNLPAYVVCFINPVNWDADEANMHDLRNKTRETYKDANGRFAMSNSSYFGSNALTGESDVKISGTPIPEDYLLKAKPTGTESDATNTLNIYVERYAAKVQFTMETIDGYGTGEDKKGIFPYTGSTPVTETSSVDFSLKFKPAAWTVNADAPTMYAIKKFALTAAGPVPTLAEVKTYLGGWNDAAGQPMWNDPTNFRSYWSCSPAFFATDFPQVSDQIADNVTDGTGAGSAVSPYALKYYSYNQVTSTTAGIGNTGFAVTNADGTGKPTRYVLENTMGQDAIKSLNPKAATPSVLIVGQYDVTYGGAAIAPGTTFYILNNKEIYFETTPKTTGNTDVSDAVLIKDKLISRQQILYVYNAQKKEYEVLSNSNISSYVNNLEVTHPDKDVRGQNLVPHRFVTLQLKSENLPTGLYFRPNGSGEFTQVTAANLTAVNTLLWQQVGVAYAYTEGKCYYSVPIHHLRISEDKTNNPLDSEGKLDWSKLRVGDMGLVRNHVYNISIQAIEGLATGIEDDNYPIVPPMDADDYYVKYQINILGWRIVPEQSGIIL